ncbi:restriction endonuclease [Enterococcus cecorum]
MRGSDGNASNQSVIVISSRFTKDARAFAEERENLMALWDIDDLLKLIMN